VLRVACFSAITSLYDLDSNTRSIIIQLRFELSLSLVLTENWAVLLST